MCLLIPFSMHSAVSSLPPHFQVPFPLPPPSFPPLISPFFSTSFFILQVEGAEVWSWPLELRRATRELGEQREGTWKQMIQSPQPLHFPPVGQVTYKKMNLHIKLWGAFNHNWVIYNNIKSSILVECALGLDNCVALVLDFINWKIICQPSPGAATRFFL